ncbi:MAG: DNA starvation/stationary phase protection protein [Aerococcus sp.]|nr:DNA starvation/stationary phase protection protein [Aerococcus sp.]
MSYTKTKQALNQLVADLTHMHLTLHQIHWYMRGDGFLYYHPKMDEMMEDVFTQLDDVSERLITIDGEPYSSFGEYLEHSQLPDQKGDWSSSIPEDLSRIAKALRVIIADYEAAIAAAQEEGDIASEDLATGYLGDCQKTLWMIEAEGNRAPHLEP